MAVRANLAAALLATVALAPAADHAWTGVERIVAVGDVHGDYHQFVTVLRSAGVLDEHDNWVGGATHLVQTGDVPDRGPGTRKVLELLQKLERQALRHKGMVHALIGNHEAMNVLGDLRYVTPEEYASFRTRRSESRRQREYTRHVKAMKARTPPALTPAFDAAYRDEWFARHPPGFFEHRRAFAPEGSLGKWIVRNNAVIRINDILFLHGGLSPKYANASLAELNKGVQDTLQGKARIVGSIVVDTEGPLWYRGTAQNPEATEAATVDAALARHGAKRIVIGHTPTDGAVVTRFGGKVILIDVGLSASYGSRQACLLIENGKRFSLHRGRRLELPANEEESLRYLEVAAALDPAPSPLLARIEELRARSAVAR